MGEIIPDIQRAMASELVAWNNIRQHLTSLSIVSQNEAQKVNVIGGVDRAIFMFIWCRVKQNVFKEISKYARIEKLPIEHLYLHHNTGDGGDPWVVTTTTIIKISKVGDEKYVALDYAIERGSQVLWGTDVPY